LEAEYASNLIVIPYCIQLDREYIKALDNQIIKKDTQLSKFSAGFK